MPLQNAQKSRQHTFAPYQERYATASIWMNTLGSFQKLEQELQAFDKSVDKYLAISVFIVISICICALTISFFLLNISQPSLVLLVIPVLSMFPSVYYSKSHQRKAKIFARHGYQCQNCKKTPSSINVLKSTSKNFCPFCQLKYFP